MMRTMGVLTAVALLLTASPRACSVGSAMMSFTNARSPANTRPCAGSRSFGLSGNLVPTIFGPVSGSERYSNAALSRSAGEISFADTSSKRSPAKATYTGRASNMTHAPYASAQTCRVAMIA